MSDERGLNKDLGPMKCVQERRLNQDTVFVTETLK